MSQPSLLHCGAVCRGEVSKETMPRVRLSPGFSHFPQYSQANCALLVLIRRWGLCMFQDPVGLSNGLFCEIGSFSCHCNPHRFLQPEALKLSFSSTGTLGTSVCVTFQLFLLVYLHMNVGLSGPGAAALPHVLFTQAACLHPSYQSA